MNTNPQESAISLAACGKLIALGLAATGVDLLIIKAVNTHYLQLAIIGGFFLMVGVVALVEKGIGNRDVDPPFRHYTSALPGEIFWDHLGLPG